MADGRRAWLHTTFSAMVARCMCTILEDTLFTDLHTTVAGKRLWTAHFFGSTIRWIARTGMITTKISDGPTQLALIDQIHTVIRNMM